MSTLRSIVTLIAALILTACASTPDLIVGASAPIVTQATPDSPRVVTPSPAAPAPLLTPGPILAKDLVSATYNLDEAVKIGALSATDPAVGCMHDVLRQAGLDSNGAPAVERQSFVPKKDGAVSVGTTLYIIAAQARQAAAQRFELAPECLQIVGRIHVDALKLTARAGAAALPSAIAGGLVGDVHAIGSGVKMLEAMPKR